MNEAETIIRQLGGNHFRATTGAKDFTWNATEKALAFTLPHYTPKHVRAVRITLADDLYTMVFFPQNIRREPTSKAGIFADDLADAFEAMTGLCTSLGKGAAR